VACSLTWRSNLPLQVNTQKRGNRLHRHPTKRPHVIRRSRPCGNTMDVMRSRLAFDPPKGSPVGSRPISTCPLTERRALLLNSRVREVTIWSSPDRLRRKGVFSESAPSSSALIDGLWRDGGKPAGGRTSLARTNNPPRNDFTPIPIALDNPESGGPLWSDIVAKVPNCRALIFLLLKNPTDNRRSMWPQSRYRGRQRVYLQAMRSPTSLHESRVYSQKNF
jgi:hypothetical protein